MRKGLSKGFVFSLSATIAWAVLIFCFSAQNGSDSSGLSNRLLYFICDLFNYSPSERAVETMSFCIRKAAHMTEFGIFGLLILNMLRIGLGRFCGIYAASFALASVYAALDEFHQLFVSGRSGQLTDWLIDSVGVLLYLTAAWLLTVVISARRQKAEKGA